MAFLPEEPFVRFAYICTMLIMVHQISDYAGIGITCVLDCGLKKSSGFNGMTLTLKQKRLRSSVRLFIQLETSLL